MARGKDGIGCRVKCANACLPGFTTVPARSHEARRAIELARPGSGRVATTVTCCRRGDSCTRYTRCSFYNDKLLR
jgi:hypothetical protein